MILTVQDNMERDEKIITLRYTGTDLVHADITPFDWMLFRECENSDKVSDKLLALETLARRIEQARHNAALMPDTKEKA